VDLEYASLVFPQGLNLTDKLKRLYEKEYSYFIPYKADATLSWRMPYCRVCNSHYLRFQIDKEGPIEINVLSTQDTVVSLFQNAGFSRIEQSNTAQYHAIFLERFGDLKQAVSYLVNPTYRSFLEILADNSN
ncbi:MAG TPA: hypothetical protein VFV38_42610, partial [Ktedonobacteraceae bacterium]|nr:hypothetical protein [Ktedonobacteraceae bacterium]